MGEEYILKGKERSDDTLFEKVKPIMDWKHGAYKQGPIGLFGAEPRVLWDNMMVYQPGTDPYAVESSNKLTDTWARIKSRRWWKQTQNSYPVIRIWDTPDTE